MAWRRAVEHEPACVDWRLELELEQQLDLASVEMLEVAAAVIASDSVEPDSPASAAVEQV